MGTGQLVVHNVSSLARTIERNLFSAHLATGISYGLMFQALISAPLIVRSPNDYWALAFISLTITILALLYAWLRLSAHTLALKICSLPIFLFFAVYFLVCAFLPLSFILMDAPRSAVEERFLTALFMGPIGIYYAVKILRGQISVWRKEYLEFADLVRKHSFAKTSLYGLIPPYARKPITRETLAAWIISIFSAGILGFAVLLLLRSPFVLLWTPLDSRGVGQVFATSQWYSLGWIFGGVPALVLLGYPLRKYAADIVRRRAHELGASDNRPPILYLRAFKSDRVKMTERPFSLSKFISQSYRLQRVDELVTERFWPVGPVIAISNPNDQSESFAGPVLQNETSAGWKRDVLRRLSFSRLVLVNLSSTPGLAWEINECLKPGNVEKAIFIVGAKSKRQRSEDISSFCTKAGIADADPVLLSNTLLCFRSGSAWEFLIASKRRVYEFDAALLIAVGQLALAK